MKNIKKLVFLVTFQIALASCSSGDGAKDDDGARDSDENTTTGDSNPWLVNADGPATTVTIKGIKTLSLTNPGGGEDAAQLASKGYALECEADDIGRGLIDVRIEKLPDPPAAVAGLAGALARTSDISDAVISLRCASDSQASLTLPPLPPAVYVVKLEVSGSSTGGDCSEYESHREELIFKTGTVDKADITLEDYGTVAGSECP